MGKRSREKKLIKLEILEAEKREMQRRRQERIQPIVQITKKAAITLACTIFLLAVGVAINTHLPTIIEKIKASN